MLPVIPTAQPSVGMQHTQQNPNAVILGMQLPPFVMASQGLMAIPNLQNVAALLTSQAPGNPAHTPEQIAQAQDVLTVMMARQSKNLITSHKINKPISKSKL